MTGQNDRQDRSLTGHVHNQAGHCPLTGRYFEPCLTSFLWIVRVQKMGQRDVFVKYAVIKSSACYSALFCTREEKTLMTENTRGKRS